MTVGADVRSVIVTADLVGEQVYRDSAPETATLPYVVFIDPIADVPQLVGDAETLARRHLIQVDLWEHADGVDPTLPDQLVAALDGAPTSTGYRMRVEDRQRITDPDQELAHTALTVGFSRLA